MGEQLQESGHLGCQSTNSMQGDGEIAIRMAEDQRAKKKIRKRNSSETTSKDHLSDRDG